jgi:hypothetical protein
MSTAVPPCRTVVVSAFRGDRSRAFAKAVLDALDDERHGRGAGPTALECLLFTGHAGVSTDGNVTVSGFNPTPGPFPMWRLMDGLRNGEAFPGAVTDDTVVFATARQRGLPILSFEVALPDTGFLDLVARLDAERRRSQYSYGFPDGNGDCNCITWLERLGLPLLTGRLDEFAALLGVVLALNRRFGACS